MCVPPLVVPYSDFKVLTNVYIYIYIYKGALRERERERERGSYIE